MDPFLISICLVLSLAGCSLGLMTGLVPGIHVNTLASVLLILYPAIEVGLSQMVPPEYTAIGICCAIMSASVVHSFVDFVPSVFIGAPDGEDALSVLPGHRLLLAGEGMRAVRSAAVGSLIGCSAAIVLAIPVQYVMMSGLSDALEGYTKMVLLIVTFILIMNERRHLLSAILSFLLSGALGYAVMNLPIPASGLFGEGTLLMPMLTGLFGLPVLLESDGGHPIPRQTDDGKDHVGIVPGLKGVLMGAVAGWFPGITSTVGATVSATVMPERSPERFISTVASIGTVTTILSLVTLSVSGGGRSGTVIVIGDILGSSISGFATDPFILLLMASALASLIGYRLTIMAGKLFTVMLTRIDQLLLNRCVIVFLIVMVIATTGLWGIVILICALMIGFIPVAEGMGKTTLCGCLILPVMTM